MSVLIRNIKRFQPNCFSRLFSRNVVNLEKSTPTVTTPIDEAAKYASHKHKVNNLEKRILVWTGKYKNIDDVPATVAPETMEKARNKARIRLANYMMVATLVACLMMVISGKKAQERGDTVQKANIEWHRRVNEEEMKRAAK